ncbi:MAG: C4-type zinc ribbon domain-containing protein [Candidatus Azobacteroides pseudotrichonymphae]|jgi:predicted  nucleic acid-binding Zn-ribbon protein|nr:MAG: C4-type zinc ribbon domain-containing protein [Candidatus Azobacteroides pseudotrichonymphae]
MVVSNGKYLKSKKKGSKCGVEVDASIMNSGNNDKLFIEDKLVSLYRLQLVLSEIDKIRTLRGELPFEVQDLEDEVAGLHLRIENFQKSLLDFEKKISQEKIRIINANALIAKYMQQIDNVRNNREYDSLSKEIAGQELDMQLAEKYIREFTEKIKFIEEEIKKSKQLCEEQQVNLNFKKEELNKIISETKIQEEQLMEKAKQIEMIIDDHRILMSFERIRKRAKNGLAVVHIQRGACGGCFNKIPPQRQMEIKMRKKIIPCEHCGRIIIDSMMTESVE